MRLKKKKVSQVFQNEITAAASVRSNDNWIGVPERSIVCRVKSTTGGSNPQTWNLLIPL